eukprot:GFKZ01008394.1.p1 GENE.GFKZ01008394.1~~GFKZ01008394.1.p1  ORF type:complete len:479 (-),score=77.25 GFKZ01008394.1:1119-2411(-)
MPPLSRSALITFTPSLPLPRQRVTSSVAPCICMKAKRGAAKSKRSAKSKRPSGAGFGPSQTPTPPTPDPDLNPTGTPPQPSSDTLALDSSSPSDPENDSTPSDEQVEQISGGTGNETPHQVLVPEAASSRMANPQDELQPDRDLAAVPTLSRERIAELRLPRVGLDEAVELFEDSRQAGTLADVVVANRDMVTEKLLYRFTSAILQVENRSTDVDTREEEAVNMRSLRKDLIAYSWAIDYPLKVEIQRAEARLLPVLQGTNVKKDVRKNCGSTQLEVDAFWIVIFAAVAAWEDKGKENKELVNVDIKKQLKAAADACDAVDEVQDKLSPALKSLQRILTSTDPSVQATVVEQIDDDIAVRIGTLAEQVRLLPIAAYGALTSRMMTINDYILKVKYGYDPPELKPFRFNLPDMERGSKLANFGKSSLGLNR